MFTNHFRCCGMFFSAMNFFWTPLNVSVEAKTVARLALPRTKILELLIWKFTRNSTKIKYTPKSSCIYRIAMQPRAISNSHFKTTDGYCLPQWQRWIVWPIFATSQQTLNTVFTKKLYRMQKPWRDFNVLSPRFESNFSLLSLLKHNSKLVFLLM